ncbi:NACHT, LRR and PYD domains-containing protein 12-like, partial [Silurus meridionalis]
FQKKFKFNLMEKFQWLNILMLKQENRTLLNEIYTELYITEGDSGDVNKEHEVKQIEAASRRNPTEDTPIKCSDIFKPIPEQDKAMNILTKGVSGIGKTVSVQKFVLDWAEGKTNQDIHLIFPLPFRELNLIKEQKLSLVELLHVFFKETKEMDISSLEKVLLIFDGLDECRFPLDFQKTVRVCDVTESAPVHVLLINLIKGNLLPSALIWITSRPAAADQIPSECVHRVTEVRGFNDPQKGEYFRKRISDQNLANKIITHLKSLRSLYIMCHIPLFCWISAAVLERMLGEAESGEIPKTLTQMYTHFLIIQTNIIREKYLQKQESDEEMLLKLGKLAFQQLEKQNLIFYEEDLRECGIDVTEAAVYSGVCTQIFREEFGLHQSKVYCFVHLSIQEHLAALYVHLNFMKEQRNVLRQNQVCRTLSAVHRKHFLKRFQVCRTLSDVHRRAVDKALNSQTGHLDLFLRFLLGLSLESNQKLLHSLITQTGSSSQNREETVQYIKKKISEDLSTEKSINLFHCLNELGDDSLVEEIQQYLKSGAQSELSPSQWSALVFVLLTSAQDLEEFDLNKYITPDKIRDEILVRVMPVIAASRKAIIRCSGITGRSGEALTSVLNSETSSLRELHLTVNKLDLSAYKLEDSGVKRLSALLENPELYDCGVSDEGCAALASALRSNPSHLRELNLSRNKVGDSGVKCLSAVLENPHCKLEILGDRDSLSSHKEQMSCEFALFLRCDGIVNVSPTENLYSEQSIDLQWWKVGKKTERVKCVSLCICRLCECGVSDEGCAALASALRSNPSHLRDLNLTLNKVGDSGVKCLSAVLENPHCKLEILGLRGCGVSDKGCAALASALRSNPSHLRDLNLTLNKVGDSGVKCLSAVLENPHCKLEILSFYQRLPKLPKKSKEALEKPLCAQELWKPLQIMESGKAPGFDGLPIEFYKVFWEVLGEDLLDVFNESIAEGLCDCGVSDEGCAALASALRSNPSHLRELYLSGNKVGDSGVKCLSAVLENPHCKLEILRLYNCGVSDEGCAALALALRSNPSHLRELDLYKNNVGDSGVKILSDL